MGYDVVRFVENTVDRDLVICPICLDVFEQPIELPECQHIFCSGCIRKCLSVKNECPLDRMPVSSQLFSPNRPPRPNRSLRIIMERLRIKCIYSDKGCTEILDLAQMEHHQKRCEFKPAVPERKHVQNQSPQSSEHGAACPGSDRVDFPFGRRRANRNPWNRDHHAQEGYWGLWMTLCFIIVFLYMLLRRR